MKYLAKIEALILKIEYVCVIFVLLSMCLLAFTQVVLRNLFSFSFIWADVVVRMGVLWVAILGASIATSERGHIHIDLFSKILSKPYDRYLEALLHLTASAVCFVFFLVASEFVSVEKEVGSVVDALHTPEWVFTIIFPIGFILMAFKFLLCFFADLGGKEQGDGGGG